jgi:hypothetical protein
LAVCQCRIWALDLLRRISPRGPVLKLFSKKSRWAWAGRTEVGFWPKAYLPRFGQLSKQQAKLFSDDLKDAERIWIAFCEAAAALFCLRRILPYIEPCSTLTFNEDNQNVVAWLAKLNCPSAMSKGIICEISWLLACWDACADAARARGRLAHA